MAGNASSKISIREKRKKRKKKTSIISLHLMASKFNDFITIHVPKILSNGEECQIKEVVNTREVH